MFLVWISAFLLVARAEPIHSRNVSGAERGFLLLRDSDGKLVATGDLIQVVSGRQVRAHVAYHFHDGSVDDETTVYTQGAALHLVSDHHIQKGPSFPKPMDVAFEAATGQVTWHEFKDGKDEVKTEHMDLPDDLANGIVPLALANVRPGAAELKVSYLTAAGKPRVVKLKLTAAGEESFSVGGSPHKANVYNVHIELGGLAGAVAPVIGKQPGDIQVWMTAGEVQTAVKMVGALYDGGPVYTSTEASPVWGAK